MMRASVALLTCQRMHTDEGARILGAMIVGTLHQSRLRINISYSKFTDLVRLCLDPKFNDRSSWKPYRREIVETLLKRQPALFTLILIMRLQT